MSFQAHNFSVKQEQEIRMIGLNLRNLTHAHGLEFGTTIHKDTFKRLLPDPLSGSARSIDLTPHTTQLEKLSTSLSHLQIHTHPRSTSFSIVDLAMFCSNPELYAMIVFGMNGSIFITSKAKEDYQFVLNHLNHGIWKVAQDATFEKYQKMWERGILTSEKLTRLHTHATFAYLANEIGLRYTGIGVR